MTDGIPGDESELGEGTQHPVERLIRGRDMIKPYLIEHGFDGLYCEECSCTVDDLMPCGGDWAIDCIAGIKIVAAHAEKGVIFTLGLSAANAEIHRQVERGGTLSGEMTC